VITASEARVMCVGGMTKEEMQTLVNFEMSKPAEESLEKPKPKRQITFED
jgi:hypothetical protein